MPEFVTKRGLTIHYRTWETAGADRPALVLLHGLGSHLEIWRPQVEELQEHFNLYAFDYPGHGASTWRGPYRLYHFLEVCEEFLDHLGLKKVHFCGLSMGCGIALHYAAKHPERVASVTLEGPVGEPRGFWHPFVWIRTLALLTYIVTLILSCTLIGRRRATYILNKIGPQTRGYDPLLDCVEQSSSTLALIPLTWETNFPPHLRELPNVRCPVLILRGDGDYFPISDARHVCRKVKGPCKIDILPGGNHVISLEQPALFNQHVIAFINSLTAAPAEASARSSPPTRS